MSQPTFMPTDLILQLLGGQRDGELISIHSEKCLLGSEESGEQSGGRVAMCHFSRSPRRCIAKLLRWHIGQWGIQDDSLAGRR